MTANTQKWGYRLGAAWIILTTLYFFAHFAYVFYQANHDAIHALISSK